MDEGSRGRSGGYRRLLPIIARHRRALAVGGVCLLATNLMAGAIHANASRSIRSAKVVPLV